MADTSTPYVGSRTESTITAHGQNVTYLSADSPPTTDVTPQSTVLAQSLVPEEEVVVLSSTEATFNDGRLNINQDTVLNVIGSTRERPSFTSEEDLVKPSGTTLDADKANATVIQAAAGRINNVVLPSVSTQPTTQSLAAQQVGALTVERHQTPLVAQIMASNINTLDQIEKAVKEAIKVDLSVTLRSKKSEVVEFNKLQVPEPTVKMTYNFFSPNERNVEQQEDQLRDPLTAKPTPTTNDLPRYVELTWDSISVKNQVPQSAITAKLNEELRARSFAQVGGNSTKKSGELPNSVEKNKKRTKIYVVDGTTRTVVDLHDQERAFDGIGNNTAFPNTLNVIMNTSARSTRISSLPYAHVRLATGI